MSHSFTLKSGTKSDTVYQISLFHNKSSAVSFLRDPMSLNNRNTSININVYNDHIKRQAESYFQYPFNKRDAYSCSRNLYAESYELIRKMPITLYWRFMRVLQKERSAVTVLQSCTEGISDLLDRCSCSIVELFKLKELTLCLHQR